MKKFDGFDGRQRQRLLKLWLQRFRRNTEVNDLGLVPGTVSRKGRGATRGGAEPLQAPAVHCGTGISQIEKCPRDVGAAVDPRSAGQAGK